MKSLRRIFSDIVIMLVVVITIMYLYNTYGQQTLVYLFGEQREGIAIDDVGLVVSYADTPAELTKGLSGVTHLDELEGKLFFFDKEDYHGIWMKDMQMSIDIFWINNNLEVVHIEKNVSPDTYPTVYYPQQPARFVLETNAFFADTYRITVGDRLTIPAPDLPLDVRSGLQ